MKKKSARAIGVAGVRAPRNLKSGMKLMIAKNRPMASIASFVKSPSETATFGHCHRVTFKPHPHS